MLFTRITADSCVYIRKSARGTVIIAVYVDDLIIAGSSERLVVSVKSAFKNRYKMKDMGMLEYVLGVRVEQHPEKNIIQLSQKTYILDMLVKYKVENCKAVDTPMSSNIRLTKAMSPTTSQGSLDMEKYPYREAVGSLLWISNGTRPDVAFAVSQVAKFMSNLGMEHWEAVKRILRYLKGTQNSKITYNGFRNVNIAGYSSGDLPQVNRFRESTEGMSNKRVRINPELYVDADYAADPDSRRSITGYIFMLAGGPISWQSRQQVSVALSTMEAEYMAACAATQEAIWLRLLLKDLHILDGDQPMIIREDNTACMAYAKNPIDYKKSKHIDVKYHFVRERVAAGEIVLEYVPSADQLADILTKPMDFQKFSALRERILGSL